MLIQQDLNEKRGLKQAPLYKMLNYSEKLELEQSLRDINSYAQNHDYHERIKSREYNKMYKLADKICQTLKQV